MAKATINKAAGDHRHCPVAAAVVAPGRISRRMISKKQNSNGVPSAKILLLAKVGREAVRDGRLERNGYDVFSFAYVNASYTRLGYVQLARVS